MIPQTNGAARPSTIGGPLWVARLAQRRRDSRELTDLCRQLDGPDSVYSPARPACTNWCRSRPPTEILAAVEIHGACKCRGWAA